MKYIKHPEPDSSNPDSSSIKLDYGESNVGGKQSTRKRAAPSSMRGILWPKQRWTASGSCWNRNSLRLCLWQLTCTMWAVGNFLHIRWLAIIFQARKLNSMQIYSGSPPSNPNAPNLCTCSATSKWVAKCRPTLLPKASICSPFPSTTHLTIWRVSQSQGPLTYSKPTYLN